VKSFLNDRDGARARLTSDPSRGHLGSGALFPPGQPQTLGWHAELRGVGPDEAPDDGYPRELAGPARRVPVATADSGFPRLGDVSSEVRGSRASPDPALLSDPEFDLRTLHPPKE
jgi:hypothetical protein